MYTDMGAGCSFGSAAEEGWSRGFRGLCQVRLAGTAVRQCLIISPIYAVMHWSQERGESINWQLVRLQQQMNRVGIEKTPVKVQSKTNKQTKRKAWILQGMCWTVLGSLQCQECNNTLWAFYMSMYSIKLFVNWVKLESGHCYHRKMNCTLHFLFHTLYYDKAYEYAMFFHWLIYTPSVTPCVWPQLMASLEINLFC